MHLIFQNKKLWTLLEMCCFFGSWPLLQLYKFLAVMSGSISDVVLEFVRVFVRPFFSFSVLGVLSSSKEFQGSFKCVSRVFEGSFKVVQRKILGCVKEVPRVFQLRLNGVSMES